MEEKEKLLKRIDDVKNDERIIQEWMVIENNRMRDEDILNTAKEEAREDTKLELIKNMLIKKYSYDDISDLTGKTIEAIKAIEETLYNN